jgi:hypothetical protein
LPLLLFVGPGDVPEVFEPADFGSLISTSDLREAPHDY